LFLLLFYSEYIGYLPLKRTEKLSVEF